MKNLMELLFIGFVMSSCDPAISYEYYLNNQSDSVLIVQFRDNGFNRTGDSIRQAQPKSEILIYKTEVWGSNPHDEKSEFLHMFDTIAIMTKSSIPIKKDIYQRKYWTYDNDITLFGFIKTGTNFYHLKLVNDDI